MPYSQSILNYSTELMMKKFACAGGFGSYLFGMSSVIANQSPEANTAADIKNPTLGWMIAFLFVVSFLGLFSVLPLRKIMIIDFKLTYPSGTATANLINGFHTPEGAELAKKQVSKLGKFFSFSFLWSFFQWFFTAGDDCGFASFPTFGLKAYQNKFYFDFSATYVGVGMICPYIINVSLLIGGILSWAVMWPLIADKKGDWYDAKLKQSSLQGLQGYKVFIAIAMILGDGLYNFVKVLGRTLSGLYKQFYKKDSVIGPTDDSSHGHPPSISYDEKRRTELFLKDQIPIWFSIAGYVTIAVISTITLPFIFHQLKWYYIIVIYIIAPALAFCNAYGCGLTDWSLASTYGKLAIFCIGAWAGLGSPDSQYPAPYALVYRNMAILGVDGFSALPRYCLTLCCVFFVGAIVINLIRDLVGNKYSRFIPVPMAMAIPFYIGSYFAIDMCLGSLILFIWEKVNKENAEAFGSAVASGLICGDGIWTLPSSILALAGVQPPICMKFLSRATNAKVDTFLG
ncbi:putative metal-nicotianamine transporter ysl7 [Stylosanthes scabra]|uniref:Metal-nicotianamine transporter ysl7 n=1 Tax=Stylosanthes scabra TaxID=79078 RepID=A0ABU6WKM7_9FABA|nr:putative metal-nicotianamine transporter ysl7 [Stylosanthes scabra]